MENKQYTTKEAIENYLNETITNNIDLYILASQQIIENYTQRVFIADEEDTERIYDGNGTNKLIIDPAIEITKVEIDDSEKTFITYPYNSLPIMQVILEDDYFPRDYKNVVITGKFGWSSCIPDDIKLAATILSAKLFKGQIKKDISSEKIGEYSVSYSKNEESDNTLETIKSILDKYKKL